MCKFTLDGRCAVLEPIITASERQQQREESGEEAGRRENLSQTQPHQNQRNLCYSEDHEELLILPNRAGGGAWGQTMHRE